MPADTILVVDAGTSALRASLVTTSGELTPTGAEPYRLDEHDESAPAGRSFDVAALRAAFERLVEQASAGREVAAVAVTGQREGMVFAGARREALFASPNVDARASAEGMLIDAKRGDDVYRTTGHLPSLMQVPAKWQWLRAHQPDVAGRVRLVLPLVDWLASTLTGRPAIERSLAAENGLLDIASGEIAHRLLADLDFDPALLPPVLEDGVVAGETQIGDDAPVPVIAAGPDTQCALLGMGVVASGEAGLPAGWSAPLQLVTDAPICDDQQRTWLGLHVLPGRWVVESNATETGRAWEWACSMIGVTPAEGIALAAEAPPGAHDCVAVTGARTMHAARMNAGVGSLMFPVPLVVSAPSRADLLRAVLESIAFAVRANLEQAEEVAGCRAERLRLGGGMSRSDLFAQIVADVIDRAVDVARSPETSALGSAALAAVATGLHASLDAALDTMCGTARTISPRSRVSAAYDDCYARWSMLATEIERLGAEVG